MSRRLVSLSLKRRFSSRRLSFPPPESPRRFRFEPHRPSRVVVAVRPRRRPIPRTKRSFLGGFFLGRVVGIAQHDDLVSSDERGTRRSGGLGQRREGPCVSGSEYALRATGLSEKPESHGRRNGRQDHRRRTGPAEMEARGRLFSATASEFQGSGQCGKSGLFVFQRRPQVSGSGNGLSIEME